MPTPLKIRSSVLATHGVLALCLGLVLLYVGANMGGGFFDVPDVALAIGLSSAAPPGRRLGRNGRLFMTCSSTDRAATSSNMLCS